MIKIMSQDLLKLSMSKYIKNIVLTARPLNVFISIATTALAANMLDLNNNYLLIRMMIVVATSVFIANALNDMFDHKVDTINRPNRPLASGAISLKTLAVAITALFIVNLIVLTSLNVMAFYFCLCLIYPMIVLYTPLFKPTPITGNAVISSILGFVFLFVDICINQAISNMLPPFILAFMLTMIREVVKDMQDLDGDKKMNLNTLPRVVGIEKTIYIVKILSLVLFASGLFLWSVLELSVYYLVTFTLLIVLPVGYTAMKINKGLSFSSAADVLKICTAAGLVVVYFMKL